MRRIYLVPTDPNQANGYISYELLPYLGSAERLRRSIATSHVLNVLPKFLESVYSKIQNLKSKIICLNWELFDCIELLYTWGK